MPITNPTTTPTCLHPQLCLEPSTHASQVGYKRPTQQRLSAAVSQSSKARSSNVPGANTFPAPLILPDDDLALDPKCPHQSMRQWIRLEDRNPVTPERNAVYVAAPPLIDSDVEFMRTWSAPAGLAVDTVHVQAPRIADVVDYLAAYYHGIPVKILPQTALKFASWDSPTGTKTAQSKAPQRAPRYVGLNTSSECIRIRTRASKDCLFERQLNLDDLLDAAISMLPDDAYALVLLVDHDLFESADDEFVCGRAYGGSRVAVISSARYNPTLDARQGVERAHAWPASHCEAYVKNCCDSDLSHPTKKRVKRSNNATEEGHKPAPSFNETRPTGALAAALVAYQTLSPFSNSTPTPVLNGLWLSRLCRTAAHELGHCFGMDHCTYYACSMQGSASLKEDARQPPYICPVDLAKMISATRADPIERYHAIVAFCAKHAGVHLFDAFRAWILQRMKGM